MRHLLISFFLLSATGLSALAQEPAIPDSLACEVKPVSECAKRITPIIRVGWGDMMFEAASWYTNSTNFNYRYIGHFFGEFQYPILDWLSVGFKADWSQVVWDTRKTWDAPKLESNRNFSNIALMPEVRFTYFRKGRVEMYSGLGYGLNINTGTELDWKGRKTACATVLDLTAYGISVGCDKWFASFEIGGLNSVVHMKREVYMLGSRLLSISIGYRL